MTATAITMAVGALASTLVLSPTPVSAAPPADRGHADATTPGLTPEAAATLADYVPLTPIRVLDTREGTGVRLGPLGPRETVDLQIGGVDGIPSTGVAAVAINLTGVDATVPTFVTAWDSGATQPLAATLNLVAGTANPNFVIVPVGANGRISLYNNSGSTHLVADVSGWIPSTSTYRTMTPTRFMDTRDGTGVRKGPVGQGESVALQITGVAGVPPSGVAAVAVNLTGVDATVDTFVTAWNTGVSMPLAATLNLVAREANPNFVIVPVGVDGTISIFNNTGSANVVADVSGWIPTASTYHSMTPTRVMDTRVGTGVRQGPITQGGSVRLQIAGAVGIPTSGVAAVAVNLTGVDATDPTFVTAWNSGVTMPLAATLNLVAGTADPNFVIVPVGADGSISLYNNTGSADLVADVAGWFPSDAGSGGPVPEDTTPTTTQPPGSSTTTPTTPSTTTPPIEPTIAALHFEPELMLLEPGMTADARLVFTDTAGAIVEGPSSGVSLEASKAGVADVELLADGLVRVTAGPLVASVLFAAGVDGVALTAPLTVSIADVREDTALIDDRDILFPLDPVDGQTLTAVGPFDRAEIESRVQLPNSDDLADEIAEAEYPVVIRGTLPPGTAFVVGSGGSAISGAVRDLVVRSIGGVTSTLFTVRLGSLAAPFRAYVYDITYDERVALGTATPLPDVSGPADDPSASAPSLTAAPTAGRRGATGSKTLDAPPTGGDSPCGVDGGGALGELKAGPQLSLTPYADFDMTFFDTGYTDLFGNPVEDVYRVQMSAGVRGTGSFGVEFKGQLSASAKIECTFPRIARIAAPVFPAPIGAFISIYAKLVPAIELELKATGGPYVEWKAMCSTKFDYGYTFGYVNQNSAAFSSHTTSQRTSECTDPTPKFEGNQGGGTGYPLSVELTLTNFVEFPLGLKIGGIVAEKIAKLFGDEELGDVEVMKAKIGPRFAVAWENTAKVLAAEEAGSKANVEVAFEVKLEVPILKWFTKKITGGADGFAIGVVLASGEVKVASFYRALNGTQPMATVEDEAESNAAVVRKDNDIVIKIVAAATPALLQISPPGEGTVSAWLETSEDTHEELVDFLDTTAWDVVGDQVRITAEGTVDEDLCEQIGKETKPLKLLLKTKMFGVLDTAGWGGAMTIRCAEPTLEWDPTEMVFTAGDLSDPDGNSGRVDLQLKDGGPWKWELEDDFPDWLDADTMSGTFLSPTEATIDLTVDCEGIHETVTHTITARTVEAPVEEQIEKGLLVTAECLDDWIKVTPGTFSPGGGTAKVTTSGTEMVPYTVRPSSGSLFTISPNHGDWEVGVAHTDLSVSMSEREPTCNLQPALTVPITVAAEGRGAARFVLRWQEVPKKDCPPPPPPPERQCPDCVGQGSAAGDPHMSSMDGVRYGAQVRGDYVYLAPTGDESGPLVQVRHERMISNETPTVVQAVAVRVAGHRVEYYGIPSVELRIDGLAVSTIRPATVDVGDGVYVTYTAGAESIRLVAPGLQVDAVRHIRWVELDVRVPMNAPLRGLLGNLDGNQNNDLQTSNGVDYTESQVREHSVELIDFTESWRVTKLSDSLFFRTSSAFAAENLPDALPDVSAQLDQAREIVGRLGRVCAGLGPDDVEHFVEELALELAMGTSVQDLGSFTCTYRVEGGAVSDDTSSTPVGGVEVTLDAVGLQPCTTISDTNGSYTCAMYPDFTELSDDREPLPFAVVVEARWPGEAPVVASGATTFDQLADLGAAQKRRVDLTMPPGSIQAIDVSGTALRNGVGYPGGLALVVEISDSSNQRIEKYEVVVPVAAIGGAFSYGRPVPRAADHVLVTAKVGAAQADWDYVAGDIVQGETTPIVFTIAIDPPSISVNGIAVYREVALPPATRVVARSFGADGSPLAESELGFFVKPNQTTGAYLLSTDLVEATRFVELSIANGLNRFSTGLIPVVPGQVTNIDWDIEVGFYGVIDVSGKASSLGEPLETSSKIKVETWDESGDAVEGGTFQLFVDADQQTGAYERLANIPTDARQVRLSITVLGYTYSTGKIPVEVGLITPIVFDIEGRRLNLDGVLSIAAVPIDGPLEVAVGVTPQDSNGQLIGPYAYEAHAEVNQGGGYGLTLDLPPGTSSVELEFQIGSGFTTTIPGIIVGVVDEELDIDIAARTVVFEGQLARYTDTSTVDFDVVGVAWDEDDFGEPVPWTSSAPIAVRNLTFDVDSVLIYDENGEATGDWYDVPTYSFVVDLPLDATLATVQLLSTAPPPEEDPDDPPNPDSLANATLRRTVELPGVAAGPNPIDLDMIRGPHVIEIYGTVGPGFYCADGQPFVFLLDVSVYGTNDADGNPVDGTLVYDEIVVPALDGTYSLILTSPYVDGEGVDIRMSEDYRDLSLIGGDLVADRAWDEWRLPDQHAEIGYGNPICP